jgi:hypothetical protein
VAEDEEATARLASPCQVLCALDTQLEPDDRSRDVPPQPCGGMEQLSRQKTGSAVALEIAAAKSHKPTYARNRLKRMGLGDRKRENRIGEGIM